LEIVQISVSIFNVLNLQEKKFSCMNLKYYTDLHSFKFLVAEPLRPVPTTLRLWTFHPRFSANSFCSLPLLTTNSSKLYLKLIHKYSHGFSKCTLSRSSPTKMYAFIVSCELRITVITVGYYSTSRKVAGSNPDEVDFFFSIYLSL
jgi:hypothetical protein